jgi:hypothetical protein
MSKIFLLYVIPGVGNGTEESLARWVKCPVLLFSIHHIGTCRELRVTKITGSNSDDWIY